LEADRVYIIEPQCLPAPWVKQEWEIEQENNLAYVAYTRAKNELVFVPESEFTTRKK
jgi:superfamily I DNA/RNA helicase